MQIGLAVAVAPFVAVLPSTSTSAQSCDCDVSESRERAYDALLELTPEEIEEADLTHPPYGQPARPAGATKEKALHQAEYVLNYDADRRVPTWVAYRLRDVDVNTLNASSAMCTGPW